MRFQAVLFDIGDTLWYDAEPLPAGEFRRLGAERTAALLAAWGRRDDAAPLATAAWDALLVAMDRTAVGDLVEPNYPEAVADALRAQGYDFGAVQAGQILEAVYVSGREAGKRPYPGAADVLSELRRRGLRLATVTNRAFGGERFRRDMADIGIAGFWEVEAVSCEVGYLKPHPAIFEWALDRLSLGAADVLMVGNSLAQDVAGAQRLGIAAAWKRSKPDAEGVIPDYVIDDITELLSIPGLGGAP